MFKILSLVILISGGLAEAAPYTSRVCPTASLKCSFQLVDTDSTGHFQIYMVSRPGSPLFGELVRDGIALNDVSGTIGGGDSVSGGGSEGVAISNGKFVKTIYGNTLAKFLTNAGGSQSIDLCGRAHTSGYLEKTSILPFYTAATPIAGPISGNKVTFVGSDGSFDFDSMFPFDVKSAERVGPAESAEAGGFSNVVKVESMSGSIHYFIVYGHYSPGAVKELFIQPDNRFADVPNYFCAQ